MVYNREYFKAYNKTYNGLRRRRIADWKYIGIIIDDYQHYYDTVYIPATHCQICNVEFCIEAKKSNTKNLDHDHQIKDRPNIRNILCHGCNCSANRTEMFKNNTSGYSNITERGNSYRVKVSIRKKIINKSFKTLSEAITFRNQIKNNT